MKRFPKYIAKLSIAFGALILLPNLAQAANCLVEGGIMECQPPIATSDWSHDLCDDMGATIQREATWCTLKGGTWNSNLAACQGSLTPVTDGNAIGLANAFENIIHPPNACSPAANPPGPCSNYQCHCQQAWFGPVLIDDFSLIPFGGFTPLSPSGCDTVGWAENVVHRITRTAGCPPSYSLAYAADGTPQCIRPIPCEKCKGNAVEVSVGQERQTETDYRSPAPGGLSFTRYYNSGGYFTSAPRDMSNDDTWRNNYSARIVPYPSNSNVMAAAVRPSGVARHFNLAGAEVHNSDGAAYRLQKLTDAGGNVTGWTLTTSESDVESYDAQGRLVSITTRAGLATTLAYDGSGRLATVTDAFGRSLSLTYDGGGNLATMTDPGGQLHQYAYDSLGRLSTVTHPGNATRTYLYEDATWHFGLTGILDERGSRFATFGYGSDGRAILAERAGSDNQFKVTSRAEFPTEVQVLGTDAFNATMTYHFAKIAGTLKVTIDGNGIGTENRTYDANGNTASIQDRRGITTTYVYDLTRNLETSRTEASGTAQARTITTTWNPTYRLPATITEPSGLAGVNLVTTFTYDTAGNLTKKNLTAGTSVREWNYTYNARGQVLTIDGPRTDVTDVTTLTYYADNDTCVGCRGQVYTVTDAAGRVTTFNAYDLDGHPTQITDANGVATALTYTPRGWLESRTIAGETTTYDYDLVGNLTKVTMPDASWVHYTYDAASSLVGVDDSLGNAIDYVLDTFGNRVQEDVYDPAGQLKRTMQRLYDLGNRLQNVLGATSQTTAYAYDADDNLTKVTDPNFYATTNTYDALNRLTNITDPYTGATVFTYDAKDHLKTVKDPKISATTTYNYDGLGNLASQVSPDTGTTSFNYDAAGNVLTQTDARSTVTTYAYDVLNRVTAATVTDGTVTYEYDNTTTGGPYALGRLTRVTDPSGNTTYTYDALGRVTAKTQIATANPANKTYTVGYSYANGRQTGLTYPSGHAVTYGFDSGGHVSSVVVDGISILASGTYFPFGAVKAWTWGNGQAYSRTYDLDGRISTITQGPDTATYADLSEVFGYDALNRLVSANLAAGQTQSFAYDFNGNRINATINSASTTYTYPSTSHRLSSLSGATSRSFTYDNAGNTTVSAGIAYTYDGRGRMKQAGTTTYAINGLGQRVKKNNGSDTFFGYDEAGHLIGEYDATGAPIEETIWLGDLPVAVVKPKAPSGFDVFYIWTDNLGTPRQITDATNQSRWEWPSADPFGNNQPNENPGGLGAFNYNLRFPGQYYDAEKASNYNYFRDYDPATGRYIESDPIGVRGGLNTYRYGYDSPSLYIDPLGLSSDCTVLATLNGAWTSPTLVASSASAGEWSLYPVHVFLTQGRPNKRFGFPGMPGAGVDCFAVFTKNITETFSHTRQVQTLEYCMKLDCGRPYAHFQIGTRTEEELFTKTRQSIEENASAAFHIQAAVEILGQIKCLEWLKTLR